MTLLLLTHTLLLALNETLCQGLVGNVRERRMSPLPQPTRRQPPA